MVVKRLVEELHPTIHPSTTYQLIQIHTQKKIGGGGRRKREEEGEEFWPKIKKKNFGKKKLLLRRKRNILFNSLRNLANAVLTFVSALSTQDFSQPHLEQPVESRTKDNPPKMKTLLASMVSQKNASSFSSYLSSSTKHCYEVVSFPDSPLSLLSELMARGFTQITRVPETCRLRSHIIPFCFLELHTWLSIVGSISTSRVFCGPWSLDSKHESPSRNTRGHSSEVTRFDH